MERRPAGCAENARDQNRKCSQCPQPEPESVNTEGTKKTENETHTQTRHRRPQKPTPPERHGRRHQTKKTKMTTKETDRQRDSAEGSDIDRQTTRRPDVPTETMRWPENEHKGPEGHSRTGQTRPERRMTGPNRTNGQKGLEDNGKHNRDEWDDNYIAGAEPPTTGQRSRQRGTDFRRAERYGLKDDRQHRTQRWRWPESVRSGRIVTEEWQERGRNSGRNSGRSGADCSSGNGQTKSDCGSRRSCLKRLRCRKRTLTQSETHCVGNAE